jgi:hypothetical protein
MSINAMQLTRGAEPSGNIIVGRIIVNEGKVVRPSQLIASVRRTLNTNRCVHRAEGGYRPESIPGA